MARSPDQLQDGQPAQWKVPLAVGVSASLISSAVIALFDDFTGVLGGLSAVEVMSFIVLPSLLLVAFGFVGVATWQAAYTFTDITRSQIEVEQDVGELKEALRSVHLRDLIPSALGHGWAVYHDGDHNLRFSSPVTREEVVVRISHPNPVKVAAELHLVDPDHFPGGWAPGTESSIGGLGAQQDVDEPA